MAKKLRSSTLDFSVVDASVVDSLSADVIETKFVNLRKDELKACQDKLVEWFHLP